MLPIDTMSHSKKFFDEPLDSTVIQNKRLQLSG